jgi:ribosomal protein S18 acetylase RimI-like enzyme
MCAPDAPVIRPAVAEDVPGITACACAAFLGYIERIGRQPAPMLEDYAKVIAEHQVHVAVLGERVAGFLELMVDDEGLRIETVAVDPSSQGTGVGRALLRFAEAEARRQGYPSLYLMTNEKMTENQALYSRIGYVLYDRRTVNGYTRVVMRKELR